VTPQQRLADHWRHGRRLVAALLLVWFGVSFVIPFFARELSFEFFGWPFAFWVASQGALFVFVAIVVVYNWRMDRLAERLDVHDD
jgi:putative solute:sodium symporter small subunit